MSLWAWREIFSPDKKVKPGGSLGYFKVLLIQPGGKRSVRTRNADKSVVPYYSLGRKRHDYVTEDINKQNSLSAPPTLKVHFQSQRSTSAILSV